MHTSTGHCPRILHEVASSMVAKGEVGRLPGGGKPMMTIEGTSLRNESSEKLKLGGVWVLFIYKQKLHIRDPVVVVTCNEYI